MTPVYSTAYLGPLDYFADIIGNEHIYIDGTEKWQKQSYRNRCYIDSAMGKLMLNIPIVHSTNKNGVAGVEISNTDNWRQKHWQALKTAYGSSPFFEVLAPDIYTIFQQEIKNLLDLNTALLHKILRWLQVDVDITVILNKDMLKQPFTDRRTSFHPKQNTKLPMAPYPQVFDHKNGFLANLSILDLLFNEGPASYDYLKNL